LHRQRTRRRLARQHNSSLTFLAVLARLAVKSVTLVIPKFVRISLRRRRSRQWIAAAQFARGFPVLVA